MEGFFSKEDISIAQPRLPTRPACGACGLKKHCKSPVMKPYGEGEKGIMIIGEAPGYDEDERNMPMVGKPAQMLRKIFRKHGIDLERDCVKMNAISCYPGEEESASAFQIDCCRPLVWNEIKDFKPRLIILLGNAAIDSFLSHRWQKKLDGITKWRGWTIPDRDVSAWVCPIFHPAFVEQKSEKNPAYQTIWEQDVERALSMLKVPYPTFKDEKSCIQIIDGKELYTRLRQLAKSELSEIAFDYETTGLKPHAKGHKIVTCAIAEDDNASYAFNMPQDERTLGMLKRVLTNPVIPKIAQNMKFEHTWSQVKLGVEVKNWVHDTMLVAHMLDNRRGVSGLKFQAYVNFGIVDYDSGVSEYLKGVEEKNANSLNRILEAPRRELLYYNAMDSLLEMRLANIQRKQLRHLNWPTK